MRKELTLFERLRRPKEGYARSTDEDVNMLFDSILQHLQKMLNTRQGHSLIHFDYGMPDFVEFKYNMPDAIKGIEREIARTIEMYEPRLKNLKVVFKKNTEEALILRFEITGELANLKEEASVLFETVIDSTGKMVIKG
ncbi:MAG: type VI secretion system baseplate subunit TssE [Nitrospirae bacterium]|nr:type VI secretion system baseplate subunit TssE [Nitrospirota bacterium]